MESCPNFWCQVCGKCVTVYRYLPSGNYYIDMDTPHEPGTNGEVVMQDEENNNEV